MSTLTERGRYLLSQLMKARWAARHEGKELSNRERKNILVRAATEYDARQGVPREPGNNGKRYFSPATRAKLSARKIEYWARQREQRERAWEWASSQTIPRNCRLEITEHSRTEEEDTARTIFQWYSSGAETSVILRPCHQWELRPLDSTHHLLKWINTVTKKGQA